MRPTSSPAIDTRQLREALGTFTTGVTIVTAMSDTGEPLGLTVNSFSSVSLDPPLILFCLARDSYSFSEFLRGRDFVVNVLASDQVGLSGRFARPSLDKWRGIAFEIGANGCPVFDDALAVFQCAIDVVHEAGDHIIVVGRVEAFASESAGEPLLFYRGRYAQLAAGS